MSVSFSPRTTAPSIVLSHRDSIVDFLPSQRIGGSLFNFRSTCLCFWNQWGFRIGSTLRGQLRWKQGALPVLFRNSHLLAVKQPLSPTVNSVMTHHDPPNREVSMMRNLLLASSQLLVVSRSAWTKASFWYIYLRTRLLSKTANRRENAKHAGDAPHNYVSRPYDFTSEGLKSYAGGTRIWKDTESP